MKAWIVCSGQVQRRSWPRTKGRRTVRPSCLKTLAYIAPRSELESCQGSKAGDFGRRVMAQTGVINGPRRLATTTSTRAAASSPPAERVITTLEAMLVGRQPTRMKPARTAGSMTSRTSPAMIASTSA